MENVLLLNGDYTPITIINWKRAVELVWLDKVKIIEVSDKEARSVSISIKIPSIVALKKYIYIKRKTKFSKQNVFARDDYICQYCHKLIERACDITMDHVIPKSRGGIAKWENCVTACRKCNLQKGGKTPKEANMKLHKKPIKPDYLNWVVITLRKRKNMPNSWLEYYK